MKKSAMSTASAVAAVAVTALSAYSFKIQFNHQEAALGFRSEDDAAKFEPRFDGLRFIETLVTAHR